MNNISSPNLSPKVVRASAGTGKTFRLSSRYLQLLLLGEHPDRILATTFTRKAAGEIRERILERLVRGASGPVEARVLGQELDISDVSVSTVLAALKKFIAYQHRIQISTLDSFFVSLAKNFTTELNLPPTWSLLDPGQSNDYLDDAVSTLCLDSESLLNLLKLLQSKRGARPVHDLLVKKVSKLQELFYASSKEVWGCRFTNIPPSRDDLQEAIIKFKNFSPPLTTAKTPNLTFQKALQKIWGILSGTGNFEVRVLEEGGELISKLIVGEPDKFARAIIPEELFEISKPIVEQVRYYVLNRINQQSMALHNLMEQLVGYYQQSCNRANVLSFDDVKRVIFNATIIDNLVEIFFRIDTQINHLLLDEFQDTAMSDWVLLEPIANEVLSYADGSHTFFCVGDTKQAIYGFRGGVAEIFDHLEDRWKQLVTERLDVSRRSSQVVLDYVNQVFRRLENNPLLASYSEAVAEWQKRFDLHLAYNQQLAGFVSCLDIGEDNVATLIANQVEELCHANSEIKIGILVRHQKSISECLFELKKRGILASGEGGAPLTDSPVVSVLLSFLWLVDHPQDTRSHFHVASSPLAQVFGLTPSDPLERRDLIGRRFREQLLESSLPQVLGSYLERLVGFCTPRDYAKLQQVIDASIKYRSQEGLRLSKFVKFIQKLRIPDPEQSNIQVMTIHKSKGLEFDAVILGDLDYEITRPGRNVVLTTQESPFDPPVQVVVAVKESLRTVDPKLEIPYLQKRKAEALEALSVLYVALTRARHALYIFVNKEARKSTIGKLLAEVRTHSDCPSIKDSPVIYSEGTADWFVNLQQLNIEPRDKDYISLKVDFSPKQTFGARNIHRVSPSKINQKKRWEVKDWGRKSTDRGVLIHRLFEGVEWLDNLDFDSVNVIRELQNWAGLNHITDLGLVAEAKQIFLANINHDPIRKLLSQTNYLQLGFSEIRVQRERAISVITTEGLIVGVIDRLVLGLENEQVKFAEIIDYKSGVVSSLDFQVYSEQLSCYRLAVSEMYKISLSQIKCKLVCLESSTVQEVY